jgi:hypothetical protein
MRFTPGDHFGARIKIYRSTEGRRTYNHESGSGGDNDPYGIFGAKVLLGNLTSGSDSYPLPQDPRQNPNFKETFTMYSRPTAFGPPVAGRKSGTDAKAASTIASSPVDGLKGFNWSFTPPYYNGEAWLDLVFWPSGNVAYDLDKILAEVKTKYWRCDPGVVPNGSPAKATTLIKSYYGDGLGTQLPYEGASVNQNAMQINSSINCLGIERVLEQATQVGQGNIQVNKDVGKRWVIQPKWETPMLNFNDEGVHPITNSAGTLTMPTYGSASVPRGMWHQFGVIPPDPTKGVFLEIDDIPTGWLKNHYTVVNEDTLYNNYASSSYGYDLYNTMKSLTDVISFRPKNSKKRLGELAEKRIIREAVVAVPYVLQSVENTGSVSGKLAMDRKKFISIPKIRMTSAMKSSTGTRKGDSLNAAGQSIRDLVEKMDRYVLPPQFDFLNNDDVDPLVMYIFEFKYKLDKDDLSYIWQNLAPRDYQQITLRSDEIAHELNNTELLAARNIVDNENLRWMVFKVKQKAKSEYSDLIVPQVGHAAGKQIPAPRTEEGYEIGFNWPYDYLSVIELIKMDAQVLYKVDETTPRGTGGAFGVRTGADGAVGAEGAGGRDTGGAISAPDRRSRGGPGGGGGGGGGRGNQPGPGGGQGGGGSQY